MPRYIDAEKLCELARNHINKSVDCNDIMRFPTADVQEIRHGKWIVCGMFDDFVKCSCCGYQDTRNHVIYEKLMYCGKCGAKMDEEEA